jgi:hypothetical protein
MAERVKEKRSASEKRAEELREEVARTRADLIETIEEIEEKFSPGHIEEKAREKLLDSTLAGAERLASKARYRAKEIGRSVWDAQSAFGRMSRMELWGLGVAALAAGVALGLFLPGIKSR